MHTLVNIPVIVFFQPTESPEDATRLTSDKEGTTQTNIIPENVRYCNYLVQ